jgi:Uma2 family endonuclease
MSPATLSPPAAPRITAEEYLRLAPSDRPSELVRGRIVVMNPPFSAHGYWCRQIARILDDFVRKQDLGRVITNDGGVITKRDPDTVRGADVAYYSYQRVPKGPLPDGYWPTPELIAEVKSSEDRWAKIHEKVGEYLNAGVLTVLVLDPPSQTVQIYSPDRPVEILAMTDTLSLPDVLPGFAASVSQIYE